MKKLILSSSIASIILVSACKNETTNSTPVDSKLEVWADQIECDVKTIKPEDWADEDWNAAVKNVDRKKMFSTIMDAVLSGKQKAYSFYSNTELSVDDIKNMMTRIDSAYVEDLETGKMEATVLKSELGPDDFAFFKVREKWLFDAEAFKLTTIPTQLIICRNMLDENGVFKGQSALFYVKLNN